MRHFREPVPQPRRDARTPGTVALLLRLLGPMLLGLGLAVTAALCTSGPPRSHWNRTEILRAIRLVESGGRANPPDGDGGQAIGPYQIWRIYWQDAVAFDPGLGGDYQDCRRQDYAERVIDAYMRRWQPAAWRQNDAEVIARTHNGGPDGARKAQTLGYWQKVRAKLPDR